MIPTRSRTSTIFPEPPAFPEPPPFLNGRDNRSSSGGIARKTGCVQIEVRVIDADEFDAFHRVDQQGFQYTFTKADPPRPDTWAQGELDRAFGAFVGGEMVGIGRNYSFDVTVPGGERVPAAAVSWIAVAPTHRRRGVLTSVMQALADDAAHRSEPLSILTASEGSIYRRFGYGAAGDRVGMTIEGAHGAFVPGFHDPGRVRFVERDEAEKLFPSVYERTRRTLGSVARPEFWWPEVLYGYEAETKFMVVHETAGEADGYVFYTVSGEWSNGVSDRTIEVVDLQAVTPTARLALWRYLLDVDLVTRVKASQVPIDDPVRWALADIRRRRIDFLNDGLWVKLVDIAAALSARTYEHDGALQFEVRGKGTFALEVAGGRGHCEASSSRAGIELDADVVGALYLGQRSIVPFGAIGAAAGSTEEFDAADRLFRTREPVAMLSYF